MTWETIELDACTDCYIFVANGETPPPTLAGGGDWHWSDGEDAAVYPDGWHPNNIAALWPSEPENEHVTAWDLVASCGREECEGEEGDDRSCEVDEEFSRSDCDVCGSTLGGTRHHMTAMRQVYSDLELLSKADPKQPKPAGETS